MPQISKLAVALALARSAAGARAESAAAAAAAGDNRLMLSTRRCFFTSRSSTYPSSLPRHHPSLAARPNHNASHPQAHLLRRRLMFASRSLSSSSSSYFSSPSSDSSSFNFHRAADDTLDAILDHCETLCELHANHDDSMDVLYSSGVLTLKLGAKGTFVLNKQPPNKQIWLSSPISGPRRFDYDFTTREWRCVRDHHIVLEPFFKQEVESLFE